jgi:hypothetical protein
MPTWSRPTFILAFSPWRNGRGGFPHHFGRNAMWVWVANVIGTLSSETISERLAKPRVVCGATELWTASRPGAGVRHSRLVVLGGGVVVRVARRSRRRARSSDSSSRLPIGHRVVIAFDRRLRSVLSSARSRSGPALGFIATAGDICAAAGGGGGGGVMTCSPPPAGSRLGKDRSPSAFRPVEVRILGGLGRGACYPEFEGIRPRNTCSTYLLAGPHPRSAAEVR